MPFEIVRNDISNMQVDAIVNAASRRPRVGAGVDSAIHKKAGPSLLASRKEIGEIRPGTAAITLAYDLGAKYVIHAATPHWTGGQHGETKLLRQAYDMCLELAVKNGCESVAFPLLAAGTHGFPKSEVLRVAVGAFTAFLMEHEMQIYLVVFGRESVMLSEKLFQKVSSFIDENYVDAYMKRTYGAGERRRNRRDLSNRDLELRSERHRKDDFEAEVRYSLPAPQAMERPSLDELLKKKDAGFRETLLDLIEKSGEKNSTIYKKANITKQYFSKIINDSSVNPGKATAVALALALELDLEGTRDLIGRAGYALTNSSVFDLIIRYFIENKQFNVIEINITLYEFDQPLLGAS